MLLAKACTLDRRTMYFLSCQTQEVDISEHYGNPGHIYKYMGGIEACIKQHIEPTWWNGFIVRRCYIHDLGNCGINLDSEYRLYRNLSEGKPVYPSCNVLIENNIIRSINKDGAIIKEVDGAVMQYNQVSRTGLVSTSNGIWFFDSQNSIIQYNEGFACLSPRGNDGGPFSIDNNCRNCAIQYNYSHDNEGPGVMLFGHGNTGQGCIARGNVSYNDNTVDPEKPHYVEDRGAWGSLTVIGSGEEMLVEGNVVIAGPDTKYVLSHHEWDGWPIEVRYRNNTFYGNGKARLNKYVKEAAIFEGGNRFVDVADVLPELDSESSSEIHDRGFAETLASKFRYGPQETPLKNLL